MAITIHSQKDLFPYNTFKIGALAKYFATIAHLTDLEELYQHPLYKKVPHMVLGGGSNLLFTKDFDGLVLKNEIKGIHHREENDQVFVTSGGGENWHGLVEYCVKNGWGGVENLALIPGTVGASPIQNIGAYGVELKDVFYSLTAFDFQQGEFRTFYADECAFGYRYSVFKGPLKGRFFITDVTLALSASDKYAIKTSYGAIRTTLDEMGIKDPGVEEVSKAVVHIRSTKLPDPAKIGNAGSFFKNPEVEEASFHSLLNDYPQMPHYPGSAPGYHKLAAGWLIEQCGWKGHMRGAAGVHKNQALVLVNYGGATGSDIKKLAEEIQNSVWTKFNLQIELEVNVL